ncbi:MAG: SMI1/KNR4 family protein [Candidatus Hydrogenedentes bacterium]|nr:SMI1/KNR4 family protein [Candidatus Hydrogenedentota bacterium]
MRHIDRLITKYASTSLGENQQPEYEALDQISQWSLGDQLIGLLCLRNGFFAFESSLHLFPIDTDYSMNILAWNDRRLWKQHYSLGLPDFYCFGENIFGEQFCTYEDHVCRFDPETGEMEQLAPSIEAWAEMILEDCNLYTGYSLGHEWQINNGPLDLGTRLVPRLPFVCGGEFAIRNLVAMDALEGMRSRASLANQIHEIPDGCQIQFEIE